MNDPLPPAHDVRREIYLEIGRAMQRRLEGRLAPRQRAHPGDQLLERERLREVIVRARVQAAHAIVHGVAGGEHEDGRREAAPP